MTNLREVLGKAIERARPQVALLLSKAHGSIAEFVKDTALVTQLADGLHRRIPWPYSWFVRRKLFVRFVLGNREVLARLLTPVGPENQRLDSPATPPLVSQQD